MYKRQALPWMKQVKEETGMLTATEVATPEHVELALKYGIDILWVGAVSYTHHFYIGVVEILNKSLYMPLFRRFIV